MQAVAPASRAPLTALGGLPSTLWPPCGKPEASALWGVRCDEEENREA